MRVLGGYCAEPDFQAAERCLRRAVERGLSVEPAIVEEFVSFSKVCAAAD